MIKARIALLILSISIISLLCGCDNSEAHVESSMSSLYTDAATDTSVSADAAEEPSDDLSEDDADMNSTNTALPKEAENALYEYLGCDSMEALADSIYPSSVAEEMKNGQLLQGNYFFSGFPCSTYEDAEISECTRRSQNEVQNLAAFWAMGAALQGVSADFSAEEGYDVVVSATFRIEGEEIETMMLHITNMLTLLKITDDRWIVIPSSDVETYNVEVIE